MFRFIFYLDETKMPFRKIRNWLFNLFHFNKQERNGVFILCLILAVLVALKLLLPYLVDRNNKVELISFKVVSSPNSADIPERKQDEKDSKAFSETPTYSAERFVFNPNTISEEDAQTLGFSKKLSTTLIKFRNKGGKFFKPEDLKKLYGLSPKLYEELEPYILIPHLKKEFKKDSVFAKPHYPEKKAYTKTVVEINSADSLSIVYLKGIGPGFTKRILKYRTLLGGFHSMNQLKEIWGMTDSVFVLLSSQITLNTAAITKIPINVIDLNSLKKHPYFSFQAAGALVNYRAKHGKLTEKDVVNSGVFSAEKLQLILPYLQY